MNPGYPVTINNRGSVSTPPLKDPLRSHVNDPVMLRFLLAFACLAGAIHAAEPMALQAREASGWTVQVRASLLESKPAETEKAFRLLASQLGEIVKVVPAGPLVELRKVPLWFTAGYPGIPPRAEYHPGAEWLERNGRDAAMAKGVEFTNIGIFEAEMRRMPNFALHELAHAYHDRVLGFDEPRILAAYSKAKASGTYGKVERRDAEGRSSQGPAYAMTDHKEYFAEGTEAYFSRNDFFPFTREELMRHDPEFHALLEKIWGSPER